MSMRLRDLIHAVRRCKTAQEERATITRECALMRTAFKEERAEVRERNMAKLLFVHMLGYPTHWGQMECVKLISSPKFHEKRIGYLALTLLLDERANLLTLVVNSVARDLGHGSVHVNALALSVVSNIASAEVARDLFRHVMKHVERGGNAYTRKKAALALVNTVHKCPDLVPSMVSRVVKLLLDRSHSVLLCAVTLLDHMLAVDDSLGPKFARLVPALCKVLRKLASASYAREYTVGGVVDPFLQVRLLRLLRHIGIAAPESSEAMNEVLALVTTRSTPTRAAGNAVLYEAVQAALRLEVEGGLRVFAINVLGRFLVNKDNNIRYVALQTLCNVVDRDREAVQRHRGTVVDCLRDPDVSLRRRALDLVFALTDAGNVEHMAAEMVNYLVVATAEEREPLCAKIAAVARRFASTARWEVDTLAVAVALAGDAVKPAVLARLAYLVSKAEEHHAALAHKFFAMLLENRDSPDVQTPLLNIAAWVTGELGELLLEAPPPLPTTESAIPPGPRGELREEADVAEALMQLLDHHAASQETKRVVLLALLKLMSRFEDHDVLRRVRQCVGRYSSSTDAELQQRSVEFSAMLDGATLAHDTLERVLDRMPLLDARVIRSLAVGDSAGEAHLLVAEEEELEEMSEEEDEEDEDDDPFGLASAFGGASGAAQETTASGTETPGTDTTGVVEEDALEDIFGTKTTTTTTTPTPTPTPTTTTTLPGLGGGGAASGGGRGGAGDGAGDVDELFSPTTPVPSSSPTPPTIRVFGNQDLELHFAVTATSATAVTIMATATARGGTSGFESYVLQSAVPKYMQQVLKPASGTALRPETPITQVIELKNPQHPAKPYRMRLRLKVRKPGETEDTILNAAVDTLPTA